MAQGIEESYGYAWLRREDAQKRQEIYLSQTDHASAVHTTQYVEGIYRPKYHILTLKSSLRVT